MNYNDFNQETQLFLNKAMNIYSIVEHRHIEKMIFNFIEYQNYKYTEFDKKILSLFIAGILADGNLKEIFAQYDNIKLEDLYDFLDIKKSETDKILLNESYQEFYEENFKIDLKIIIDSKPEKIKINYITPEVIILSLKHIDFHGYKILNYLGNAYEIDEATIPFLGFSEHPIFKHLEDYTRKDGSIKDETIPKKNEFIKKNISPLILPKKESLTKNDNNIWNLLEEIKKKFIGQEKAIEELFYNIVNNQQLAKMKDIPNSQRAIIFMDGEIGTGKTAITREIIEKIKITNVITSITDCSPNDDGMKFLTNLLKELYRKAENDYLSFVKL